MCVHIEYIAQACARRVMMVSGGLQESAGHVLPRDAWAGCACAGLVINTSGGERSGEASGLAMQHSM